MEFSKEAGKGSASIILSSTGSAISAQDVVDAGISAGIAKVDIAASGSSGKVAVGGAFIGALAAVAISAGDKAYWDSGNSNLTNVAATGLQFVGFFSEDYASGASKGEVILAPYAAEGTRVLTDADDLALSANDLKSGDCVVIMSAADTSTLDLPAVADVPVGAKLTVKKTGSAGAVTIDGNGAEQVNGAATYTAVNATGDSATIISDGTAWILLNNSIS